MKYSIVQSANANLTFYHTWQSPKEREMMNQDREWLRRSSVRNVSEANSFWEEWLVVAMLVNWREGTILKTSVVSPGCIWWGINFGNIKVSLKILFGGNSGLSMKGVVENVFTLQSSRSTSVTNGRSNHNLRHCWPWPYHFILVSGRHLQTHVSWIWVWD